MRMKTIDLRKTQNTQYNLTESPSLLVARMVNWRMTQHSGTWRPPTDVFETDDLYIVRVEIAGMASGDIGVVIDKNILTIRGVRADSGDKRAYHQMEIHFGEFITEIEIPGSVEQEKAVAEYQDGFLKVTLPKSQARHITINE